MQKASGRSEDDEMTARPFASRGSQAIVLGAVPRAAGEGPPLAGIDGAASRRHAGDTTMPRVCGAHEEPGPCGEHANGTKQRAPCANTCPPGRSATSLQ